MARRVRGLSSRSRRARLRDADRAAERLRGAAAGQHLLPSVAAAALSRRQRHSLADHQGRDAHRRHRLLGRSRHRHRAHPAAEDRAASAPDDTAGSLYYNTLFKLGVEAVLESVDLIAAGTRAARRAGRIAGLVRSALPRRARAASMAAAGRRGLQPHPRLRSAARRVRRARRGEGAALRCAPARRRRRRAGRRRGDRRARASSIGARGGSVSRAACASATECASRDKRHAACAGTTLGDARRSGWPVGPAPLAGRDGGGSARSLTSAPRAPNASKARCGRRSGRLRRIVLSSTRTSGVDHLPVGDVHGPHRRRGFGRHAVLHLHRLEDEQPVAGGDLLARPAREPAAPCPASARRSGAAQRRPMRSVPDAPAASWAST